ncbi:ATP-binding cassette domain-containing protein [Thermodesulfobacteriota bacterium]
MTPTNHETAVVADGLTKTFGKFTAVDHVSFRVKRGEIFGFLGPNGAGKTTTIKILCGLLTPSAGKASVAGFDVATQYEEIRKNIGYMSQKFSIYVDLTVQENLDFFGGVYGLAGDRKRERDEWVLQMAGLVDKKDSMTGDLPLGWKQRLALGCAMLHSPPIVFLDEPTSGVDPMARRNFWELIQHVSENGVTVFVTTHYMDEAGYCNRLALMAQGKLIALGTPNELKTRLMTESVVEVECDDILRAQEILEEDETFTEVAVFGTSLHIVTPSPDRALSVVNERLGAAGIHARRAEVIPPSLEDVFVTLTARNHDAP